MDAESGSPFAREYARERNAFRGDAGKCAVGHVECVGRLKRGDELTTPRSAARRKACQLQRAVPHSTEPAPPVSTHAPRNES
jgi:hypothetical protein